jgi:hypothetical protein
MQANLPRHFSFRTATDLERIGSDNDGGYLVCKADVEKSDLLISFGVFDNWSFEEQFVQKKDVDVFAYDASVSEKGFRKQFLKSFVTFNNPTHTSKRLKTWLGYRKFFRRPNIHHIEKFVGFDSTDGRYCSMDEVLNVSSHRNIFLKIDIEGSEYRILDSLIANQERFTGLAIEFHDCDLHTKAIEYFLSKFALKLVHIHANNYAPIRRDNLHPTTLELTFSKNATQLEQAQLPHALDMPNHRKKPEIFLTIEN